MTPFTNLKELLRTLYEGRELLTEMFKRRKSVDYKIDYGLELIEHDEKKLQALLEQGVIRQSGDILEIEDLYLEFFEQILEANEEINLSYINENLEKINFTIELYFNEENERRKYGYLRTIKNTLRKIGKITLRNVVDLKRTIDNTFKNEPNYKNKKTKLIHLDGKRQMIMRLIAETERLVTTDDITFFKTATDEELGQIVVELRRDLQKASHNLIELERQIIEFLNQIQQQSTVVEKLRQIKYLKDQFILESVTDFKAVIIRQCGLIFEPYAGYPVRLSLEYLQTNDKAFASIIKVAEQMKTKVKVKIPIADTIAANYLDTQAETVMQINLEELKNSFMAGSTQLLDFLLEYPFADKISFNERITLLCQLASLYDQSFDITDTYTEIQGAEVAVIYPQTEA